MEDLISIDRWNEDRLRGEFLEDVVDHVMVSSEIDPMDGKVDYPFWMLTNSKKFTVRSTWEGLRISGSS